jgi:hypothetical protein
MLPTVEAVRFLRIQPREVVSLERPTASVLLSTFRKITNCTKKEGTPFSQEEGIFTSRSFKLCFWGKMYEILSPNPSGPAA